MRSRKRHENRIVVKRIETIAIPTEVLATSASNMAGGTIMVRNALKLLQGIPKEQLQSSGLLITTKTLPSLARNWMPRRKGIEAFMVTQNAWKVTYFKS